MRNKKEKGGRGMSLLSQYCTLSSHGWRTRLQTETSPCLRYKASIFVETTIVLPLTVGFMIVLLFFFRMMAIEIGVEQALTYTARQIAAVAVKEENLSLKSEILFRTQLKKKKVPTQYLVGNSMGIALTKSREDSEYIILTAKYTVRCPVAFFGNLKAHRTQSVTARKWIGETKDMDEETKDNYVYITPTGSAYHKRKDCSYLDLSIRQISSREVSQIRNAQSEKYRVCSSCVREKKSIYYITDYGNRYHSTLTCSGLKRTIYIVPMSQVGNRHKCGKCGE